jgi:branched-chain amino acid transport system ATP-binding protein
MPEALLTVTDIHTYYGDSYVLQGLSLSLPNGRIAAILGRNGMGKTTLVRSVAGLTPPRSGDVVFRGRSLRGMPPYAIAQQGIAIVPQGRRIFKSLSVRENLLLPTSLLARASSRAGDVPAGKRWNFEEVLKEFPQLAERIDNPGGALSGGEQQMLAIGRALMTNPRLLILDEATEGLAPVIRQDIWAALRQLKAAGQSILVVDKTLSELLPVADRCVILEKGISVFEGSPDALTPELQNRYLGV